MPHDAYVTVEDGVRLFVRTIGNGPQAIVIPNGFYLLDDFASLADGRTLILYDLRNRGRSDRIDEAARLARGIENDIDDLDIVRRHFGIDRLNLIGHSYIGLMVAVYAMRYPDAVNRLVQIGPMQPRATTRYPAHLTGTDATSHDVLARLTELRKGPRPDDPVEACRQFWSILRLLYVVNSADADRIDWGRCDLPNERNSFTYWTNTILPSIQRLDLSGGEAARATAPALIVHGTRDRSAPYGGGRDWALTLPNARLVTVPEAGHAPWIEAPGQVFDAIATFLNGRWPDTAESIHV